MSRFTYLCIGGGVASVSACKSIRQLDQTSSLAIVTDERTHPVDRPPLSKQLLMKDDWTGEDAESVDRNFYHDHKVELIKGQCAEKLDPASKSVVTVEGRVIQYEKLLIATGLRSKHLKVPGNRLGGVHTLRSVNDALALREAFKSQRDLVILGGGFIAVEVAAAARSRGFETTLIVKGNRLLPGLGSDAFASAVHGVLESLGAKIIYNDEAVFFAGSKVLRSIHTKTDREIPTGLALVAVGSELNTDWLAESGLVLTEEGAIPVDRHLRTALPSIWAAGDIASMNGIRIEHHLNAKWQGAHAGAEMVGSQSLYDRVPYVYSDIGDFHVNARGKIGPGEPAFTLEGKQEGLRIEVYTDEVGAVSGVLSWSTSDPLLDRVSQAAETLIQRDLPAEGLCIEDFTDY